MEEKKVKEEQSLLEDASTLLMFSKGSEDQSQEKRSRSQSQCRSPMSSTDTNGGPSTASFQQVNPLASPGPASVALLNDFSEGADGEYPEAKHSRTQSSSSSHTNSKKGIVAAAALAAAATVPLPLKKTDQSPKPEKEDTGPREDVGDALRTDRQDSWPIENSYVVDPDSGIITCICGFDDDDGFTIQCDHCYRWQHAICYGIKDIETAPDDHLCNVCSPRKLDVKRAKRKQQERINPKGNKKRRKSSLDEDGTGSSSSGSNNVGKNSNAGTHEIPPILEKKIENLLNAKESYPVAYYPLTENEFKDKYAKVFIEEHSDDDWVIPYNKKVFTPIPIEIKAYSEGSNSRGFSGFPKLGVFTQQKCSKGDFIDEFLGEVDFRKKYISDPRNNYRLWGTTKPKVLFHSHWPIYIDARLCGNSTRYLRRSCQPNVELVAIRMNDDKRTVKMVLRSVRDIGEGEELHIDWQWDLCHPIWRIIKGDASVESLPDCDKYLLVHSVDTVLGGCDCACGNNKDCCLLKVKKFSHTLLKLVKSKMSNRYKLNEILHRVQGKKKQQAPVLWRLAHDAISNAARAHELLVNFHTAKLKYLEEQERKGGIHPQLHTVQIHENLEERVKPFKYRLLERHLAKHRATEGTKNSITSAVTVISNPFDYDESHITDLKALPVPVEINVSSSPAIIRESIGFAQTTKEDGNGLGSSLPSAVSTKFASESPTISSDVSRPFKKKLSFADYKKKQKPI